MMIKSRREMSITKYENFIFLRICNKSLETTSSLFCRLNCQFCSACQFWNLKERAAKGSIGLLVSLAREGEWRAIERELGRHGVILFNGVGADYRICFRSKFQEETEKRSGIEVSTNRSRRTEAETACGGEQGQRTRRKRQQY